MTKRIVYIVFLLSFVRICCFADSSLYDRKYYSPRLDTRHEIRFGWGDFCFESLAFHSTRYTDNYRYTGHVFGEYLYHVNNWYSIGGQIDYNQVWWDRTRNGYGEKMAEPVPQWYANFALLCSMRFTYYSYSVLSLYAGTRFGLNVNTGTELNYKGHDTAHAFAFGLTLLGLRVGNEYVYGAFELGGLNALNNMHEIYMLGSDMLSLSFGFCFGKL